MDGVQAILHETLDACVDARAGVLSVSGDC
jgi:hypothetical protein